MVLYSNFFKKCVSSSKTACFETENKRVMTGNVRPQPCGQEHFPQLTKTDDDMMYPAVARCIKRHIMPENACYSPTRKVLEVFQMDPETVGGVCLHISLSLLLAARFPCIKLLSGVQRAVR